MCSRCSVDVRVQWTQTRVVASRGGPSTFKSSSLGVCSVLIPAAPRFFEDNPCVKDHSPTLSIPQKKKKQTVPSRCLRVKLLPSRAPRCTQKIVAEEVSNSPFKARHSMSTRRSLPLGVITVYRILSCKLLLSVTLAPGTNRAISSGELSIAVLPNISDH